MVLSLVSKLFIPCFGYAYRMAFYGFADGACRHTLNLASIAWFLYSIDHDLINSGAVCTGPVTKNIAKYHAVIGLLTGAASQDIYDLVMFMYSQLVVRHLNHIYTIKNLVLLQLFQRVWLLERSFEYITYRHIHRSYNTVADSLVNYILD